MDILMSDNELTDKQYAALQLADVITSTLEDISNELEVPVSILIEDLGPHQPFLVAKLWTDNEGLLMSVSEKTKEAMLSYLKPISTSTIH